MFTLQHVYQIDFDLKILLQNRFIFCRKFNDNKVKKLYVHLKLLITIFLFIIFFQENQQQRREEDVQKHFRTSADPDFEHHWVQRNGVGHCQTGKL